MKFHFPPISHRQAILTFVLILTFVGLPRYVAHAQDPENQFTCPCPPSMGVNIDASSTSPLYSSDVQGVLWSDIEATLNLDLNNDFILNPSEHHNCIAIVGNLVVDLSLTIDDCIDIRMQPCSKITVGRTNSPSGKGYFYTQNVFIHGCQRMWKGIEVLQYSHLKMQETDIRDAEIAVKANATADGNVTPFPTRLSITDAVFINDHIGVLFNSTPQGNFIAHHPFINNGFYGLPTWNDLLLPPCGDIIPPNYNSEAGTYAGVVSLGVPIIIGFNSGITSTLSQNQFRWLRNGIIAENTRVGVYGADMREFKGQFANPILPSFASSRQIGVLVNGGTGIVAGSTFLGLGTNIYGVKNAELNAWWNRMNGGFYGVIAHAPMQINVSENPYLQAIFAVEILEPQGNNTLNKFQIYRNIIRAQLSYDISFVYPTIRSESVVNTTLSNARIHDNKQTTAGFTGGGIKIVGNNKWTIDANDIELNSNIAGAGIWLNRSNNNYLFGNTLKRIGAGSTGNYYGFNVETSSNNIFCCNNTNNFRIGTRFFSACNGSDWRHTTISDHQYSIKCETNTFIGPQSNRANNFFSGSGIAEHLGTLPNIQQSLFKVKDLITPHWPNSINAPNQNQFVQWFTDQGTHPTCEESGDNPLDPDDVCIKPIPIGALPFHWPNGGDIYSARDLWGDPVLNWDSQFQLYERCQLEPGFRNLNPVIDSFAQAATNLNIGLFYNAEYAAKHIGDLSNDWTLALQSALQTIDNTNAQINAEWALLPTSTSNQDSLSIFQTVDSLSSLAIPADKVVATCRKWQDSIRIVRAYAALQLVNALAPANLPQSNRKLVLKVWLETVGVGNIELIGSNLQIISEIANQCPFEGGSAVFMARTLYQFYQRRSFSDDTLCQSFYQRTKQPELLALGAKPKINVAPNPAYESINLTGWGSTPSNSPISISLVSTNGRVVSSVETTELQATIPVKNLPAGLYYCHIKSSAFMPIVQKLIISH